MSAKFRACFAFLYVPLLTPSLSVVCCRRCLRTQVKLVDVEKVEWLNRRSYSAIGLFLGREGRVLLRSDLGLEDWFELLDVSTNCFYSISSNFITPASAHSPRNAPHRASSAARRSASCRGRAVAPRWRRRRRTPRCSRAATWRWAARSRRRWRTGY